MRGSKAALVVLVCVVQHFAITCTTAVAQTQQTTTRAETGERDPTRFVNPFIGTGGTGNTYPGPSLPFGMIQWSPDTAANGFYKYHDSTIRGFSMTHLNGGGCPIFADIPILPTIGAVKVSPAASPTAYAAPFSHVNETASPGYYRVKLDSGIEVELSVTDRTGIGVFKYPASKEANMLINAGGSATGNSMAAVQVVGNDMVVGWAISGALCGNNSVYTIFFAVQFDRPFDSFGTWNAAAVNPSLRTSISKQPGTYLTFDTTKNPTLKAKVGISYVSIENALLNLRTENEGWDLDAVRQRAVSRWNELLNRITVSGGSHEQNEIFYTALYHALLGPNLFNDVNGEYMGFDRLVHTARGYNHYTNISDWDTYRTQVQLQALLAPRETGDMVRSLLVDADQSGWLPKWPLANDVAAAMNGDNPVPLIATAHAFGARRFDRRAALAYMLKGATQPGTGIHGYKERPRLEEYLQNGYVAFSPHGFDNGGVNSASATLEYATDDFCIAQFAREIGDLKSHREFMRRAQNWQNLFDAEIGFIRPRLADGTFIASFDADKVLPKSDVPWERLNQAGFQEGNTWQYTWMIPFNYEGLFSAIGGDQEVVRRLDLFFSELAGWGKPYFNMANEPSFVAPYAYTFAGAPARTQATVRRIMAETFNATPGGLPGNDDMGATSAWYVWSAIGLYPAIPGVGGFVIGSPSFPTIAIETGDGRHVNITSNRSDNVFFVRSVTLNNRPYSRSWLPIEAVGPGTTSLRYLLSEESNGSWATNHADRPPSFTDGQAPAIAFINGTGDLHVEPGGSVKFSLGVRKLVTGPLTVQWVASVPPGLELRPSSGSIRVDGDGTPRIDAQLVASPRAARGNQTITIRLKDAPLQRRGNTTLPQITLGVRTGSEEQAEKL